MRDLSKGKLYGQRDNWCYGILQRSMPEETVVFLSWDTIRAG